MDPLPEICADGSLEDGFEKISIYANANSVPTHAARQTVNGAWVSKLGRSFDIEHESLNGVSGPGNPQGVEDYGSPAVYMRRKTVQP
jgi:hypothetical protein